MTGAFLRVKRNGSWENIEVEHLTHSERKELFEDRDKEEILRWFHVVCDTLCEVDDELQKAYEAGQ